MDKKNGTFEVIDKRGGPFLLHLPKKLKDEVAQAAWEKHLSMSEWIRQAIGEALARKE